MDIGGSEGALSHVPVYFAYDQSGSSSQTRVSSISRKTEESETSLLVRIPLNHIRLPGREISSVAVAIKTKVQGSTILSKLEISEEELESMDFGTLVAIANGKQLSEDEIEHIKQTRSKLKNKSAQSSVRNKQKIQKIQLQLEIEDLKKRS